MLSQAPESQPECNVWHLGAGRADGSAGLWAAEGEAKEASQQTGLWGRVEATVGRCIGKAERVHSRRTWRPKKNRHNERLEVNGGAVLSPGAVTVG